MGSEKSRTQIEDLMLKRLNNFSEIANVFSKVFLTFGSFFKIIQNTRLMGNHKYIFRNNIRINCGIKNIPERFNNLV